MDYARPDRAEALAAEYVAGTLRGRARRRFEALLPGHPALRAEVQRWQARLMPLTGPVAAVEPPPRVWQAIERRLWPAAAPRPWWQRLGPWRALAASASVSALALLLVLARPTPAPAPVLVVLQSTGADGGVPATFVASVGGDGRSLVTQAVQPVGLAPGRALELWSVPPQGAPRSLGLVRADGSTVLARERLPATLLQGGTAALAVSIEPAGGSPTGAPTGPIIYAGKVQI